MPLQRASILASLVAAIRTANCWTTTEAALTQELSVDLRDAWERLREAAVSVGDQRIYASHKSIMFSIKSCYFLVRPKRNVLELCIFLGRSLKAPQVRRSDLASKAKLYHIIHINHRDEVEAPITEWLQEAYELSGALILKTSKPLRKLEAQGHLEANFPSMRVHPIAVAWRKSPL